jgi:Spy/CpxP family protein refolding chaperone
MAGLLTALTILTMLSVPSVAQLGPSSYAGQEIRAIKALSAEEMQALLSGQGMGMAKAAELNRYPGPRHVLDLATQMQLSESQRAETQQIYGRMHREAVRLGTLVVDKERELDRLFATEVVDLPTLQHLTTQIAQLQGELRLAHLQAHVEMQRVLSPEQIDTYDTLRWYTVRTNQESHSEHQRHQH